MSTPFIYSTEEEESGTMGRTISNPAITDPDAITNSELLDKPLSSLSKGLPQTTSSRATMSIYLRWLEVHRKNPSDLSKSWDNTVMHWVQSLKARGFKKTEIIDAFRKWRTAHEPMEKLNLRYPPATLDIAVAYDENRISTFLDREREDRHEERPREERSREERIREDCIREDRIREERVREERIQKEQIREERLREERIREERIREERLLREERNPVRPKSDLYRPDSRDNSPAIPSRPRKHARGGLNEFDNPPPKNYVCNRCSRPGHHLQVCPTNLDPAYDRLPEPDYLCEVCRITGEHYKSLCPKNQDPFSIIMKRKAKGIKTPPPRKLPRIQDRWIEETPLKRQDRSRLQIMDREEGRLERDSSSPTRPSSEIPYSKRSRVKQELDMIERTKDDLFSQDENDFKDLIASSIGAQNDNMIIKEEGELKRDRPADFDLPLRDLDINIADPPKKRIKGVGFAESTDFIDNKVEMTGGDEPAVEISGSHGVSRGSPPVRELPAPRFFLCSNSINPDEIYVDSSGIDTADEMDLDDPANKLAKVYSECIQMLMQKLPQMSNKVNKIKKRVTALDMWENGQADLAAFAPISNGSPPWSPFALEGGVEADDLFQGMANKRPLFSQFDGAGDDSAAEKRRVLPQPRVHPRGEMEAWQVFQHGYIHGSAPSEATAEEGMNNRIQKGNSNYLDTPPPGQPFPSDVLDFIASRKENVKPSTLASNYYIQRPTLSAVQAKAHELTKPSKLSELKQFSQKLVLTTEMPAGLHGLVSTPTLEIEVLHRGIE